MVLPTSKQASGGRLSWAYPPDASAKGGMRMTLSEVLLLLTFVCGVAHGVFDVTWKISHDDKAHKSKKD